MMKTKRAVLVHLERTENGNIKISLDDLIQSDIEPYKWIIDVPITFKEYSSTVFNDLEFNDQELSNFGYTIIARLYAFYINDEC